MTSGVLLRDVIEGDLVTLFEQQRDPEANRMADFPARDRDAFMAHWEKILADETVIKKAVILDGHVAGNIVCFEQFGRPLVGYWIGRDYWGKGVATKALSALLGHVKTRPLYAHVVRHNAGSIRVLEKCGFRVTGARGMQDAEGKPGEELVLELAP